MGPGGRTCDPMGCLVRGQLALLFLVCLLTFTARTLAGACPVNPNVSDTVTLRTPEGDLLPTEVRGRIDKTVDLHCCAGTSNEITVTWFNRTEGRWIPYPWRPATFKSIFFLPNNRNQTLRFNEPYPSYAGLYKCRVTNPNGSLIVEHETRLELIDCQNEASPVPQPRLDREKSVKLGENVTVLCQGYFGCSNNASSRRQAYWRRRGLRLVDGMLPNYHVRTNQSLEKVMVGSSLTIGNVQPDDLDVPLDCVLDSGQSLDTVVWQLTLTEAPRGERHYTLGAHWYVVMAVVVCLSILLFCITWKLCGPQIHFFLKSHFFPNPPADKSNVTYDLAILHSLDGDTLGVSFAEKTLRQKLSKCGYSCVTLNDTSNPSILEASGEVIRGSYCVAILMTEISMSEPTFHLVVNLALQEKHNVFCVVLAPPGKTDSLLAVKSVKEKYKGLETLKWPTDSKQTSWKIKRFWSQVRLRMPMAQSSKHDKTFSALQNTSDSEDGSV